MLLAKLRDKTRKSEGSTEENHSGEVNFTRQESRMKEWCKGTQLEMCDRKLCDMFFGQDRTINTEQDNQDKTLRTGHQDGTASQ